MDRKVGVGVVGGRMGRRIGKFSQDVGELSGVEEEEGREGGGEVRRGSFSIVFFFFFFSFFFSSLLHSCCGSAAWLSRLGWLEIVRLGRQV